MSGISNSARVADHSHERESCRGFVKKAAFTAIAGGTLAACTEGKAHKVPR